MAGRLDLAEYEERAAAAAQARFVGDLGPLLRDLPAPNPPAVRGRRWAWYAPVWGAWLPTAMICLFIWGASSLERGHLVGFWPIWVIGPWGFILLSRSWRPRRR